MNPHLIKHVQEPEPGHGFVESDQIHGGHPVEQNKGHPHTCSPALSQKDEKPLIRMTCRSKACPGVRRLTVCSLMVPHVNASHTQQGYFQYFTFEFQFLQGGSTASQDNSMMCI